MFKILLITFFLSIASLPSHALEQDPTRPAYPVNTPKTAEISIEAEPRLSAIWISGQSSWATINGVQAKQGQTIPGDIKIIKIRKNAVTINQNGNIKTLQLLQRSYKTTK